MTPTPFKIPQYIFNLPPFPTIIIPILATFSTDYSTIVLSSLLFKAKIKCYTFHEDASILFFPARTDHPIL